MAWWVSPKCWWIDIRICWNRRALFLNQVFSCALSKRSRKMFGIWDILKMATVKSVQPGNNFFKMNQIIRCKSKLLPLGFLKFVLVLIFDGEGHQPRAIIYYIFELSRGSGSCPIQQCLVAALFFLLSRCSPADRVILDWP